MALLEREATWTAFDEEAERKRLMNMEGQVLADRASLEAARAADNPEADARVAKEWEAALEEYRARLALQEICFQLKRNELHKEVEELKA